MNRHFSRVVVRTMSDAETFSVEIQFQVSLQPRRLLSNTEMLNVRGVDAGVVIVRF